MSDSFKVGLGQNVIGDENFLSPYAALEASWLNFALLKGFKEVPWGCEFDLDTLPPYIEIWLSVGLANFVESELDKDKGVITLTDGGAAMMALQPLFEYEYSMQDQQFAKEYNTDPLKYIKLRKALATYSDIFLQKTTKFLKTFVLDGYKILDYGGGEGYYLQKMMEKNPSGEGVLVDRAPNFELSADNANINAIAHDFETGDNSLFTGLLKDQIDVAVMSEVAHCMGEVGVLNSLDNIMSSMRSGGHLLVVEQYPNYRLNQRLFDMTTGGRCYHPEEIQDLLVKAGFTISYDNAMKDNTHYTITAKKE